jgi:hypothetical protein
VVLIKEKVMKIRHKLFKIAIYSFFFFSILTACSSTGGERAPTPMDTQVLEEIASSKKLCGDGICVDQKMRLTARRTAWKEG